MSLLIKCPASLVSLEVTKIPKVFLAGGITNCPDWQKYAYDQLADTAAIIMNPRRDDFDVTKASSSVDQIAWEHYHLMKADTVLFWFPKEGMCMITLFELGKCAARGMDIVVGVEPGYLRELDVREQLKHLRPDVHVFSNLDDVLNKVKEGV
jgi:hypothetical protein